MGPFCYPTHLRRWPSQDQKQRCTQGEGRGYSGVVPTIIIIIIIIIIKEVLLRWFSPRILPLRYMHLNSNIGTFIGKNCLFFLSPEILDFIFTSNLAKPWLGHQFGWREDYLRAEFPQAPSEMRSGHTLTGSEFKHSQNCIWI